MDNNPFLTAEERFQREQEAIKRLFENAPINPETGSRTITIGGESTKELTPEQIRESYARLGIY